MPAGAIELNEPPPAVMRVLNPALLRALPTPLGRVLKDFMVLRFTGRKTGRRYSVPVSAHRLDGDLYALLNANWKHNFRDGARADVVHLGKTTTMDGQLIAEPTAVAGIAHRIAESYGPRKAQRSMGLAFPGDGVPTLEEFSEAARRLGLSAIHLTRP